MSSCCSDMDANNVGAEQLCYIPCNFCNIVLAVSVPCNSLFDIVTVRCGHCTNLWSVNMAAAAFHCLSSSMTSSNSNSNSSSNSSHSQDFFPLHPHQGPNHASSEFRVDLGSSSRCNNKMAMRPPATTQERIVNRPSEKRQRVPSAYNQFIKEEIQRIKANNPDISHREAFSTAAKNWAHFPHIHFGLMLETNKLKQSKIDHEGSGERLMTRAALLNK